MKKIILSGMKLLAVISLLFFLLVFLITYFSETIPSLTGRGRIGVVEIKGPITDSKSIIDQILRYKKDKGVKAIVLRIDTPGGEVGPSQEIYEEIKRLRAARKKVVASMGSVATSGGYYIACACDKIVANPGTVTGSIGVIMEYINIEELLRKLGLKSMVIKSGKYKDILSPTRELTGEERKILQDVIDNVHEQFIEVVVQGRRLGKGEISKIADGRIFSGRQAKAIGLVDQLGNLQDAIDLAAEMVGIKGEPKVIYPEKKRFFLLDLLLEHLFGTQGKGFYFCY